MSIEKILDACKTEMELRAFAQASQKTLLQIMKKNKELTDENEHLKKLVAGAVPIIPTEKNPDVSLSSSSEEEIAKIELNKLKFRSMESEQLTLEECKKVEIYSKILTSRMVKEKKPEEREVKELNSDALLAIAESSDENKG